MVFSSIQFHTSIMFSGIHGKQHQPLDDQDILSVIVKSAPGLVHPVPARDRARNC